MSAMNDLDLQLKEAENQLDQAKDTIQSIRIQHGCIRK